jgi:hypothetical protein
MHTHPFRVFYSLLFTALGLIALMAAQARGGFLVNKEAALAKAGVTFQATQVGAKTFSVPGRNLGILCETSIIKGEFISSVEAKGSAEFTKCSAWEFVNVEKGATHAKKLPCTISEPIAVEKSQAVPLMHSSEPYLKLLEFSPIVKISGAECALPKENKITGILMVMVDKSDTVEPTGLASEATQKLLGVKMFFGAFEAFIKGPWTLKLTDAAHLGKTVGVS